ncbi:uncharacterized protein LOC116210710 isoform X2 [Punica granatum]|uniref:Uncharacterized protein LOC116210710 isoform X2 n=1 Tax=Punica granatum TaxID=22663 RepID=A0A6P8DT12_PUNGR|nr:uncharacterized protein LOC116210710 isoform X2 [Punica granatum]
MGRRADTFWEYAEQLCGRFKCNFCKRDFAGGAPRVKSHLSGIKGRDVDICTMVPKHVQALAAETIKGANKRPKPEYFSSSSDGTSSEVCHKNDICEPDDLLAKFFLSNNIDCNVVQSSSFIDFINAVAAFGASYKLPSYSTLKTLLIPKLHSEIEAHVRSVKESWGETGCTLISDVWFNEKENQSLVNIMAYSWKGVVLLDAFKVPKCELDGHFLEEIICFCIQTIGPNNVVQYIDGIPGWGPTRARLTSDFPHIYVTRCVAAEIQSSFEDVYMEIEWVKLAFDKARCLITLIYGNSDLLSLMRKYTNNRELIQPQAIDFSSNYTMLLSIIVVKDQLLQLVQSFGCSMSDLGKEVAEIISSLEFWNQVEEIVQALESLFLVLYLVDRYGSSSGYLYVAMEMATEGMRRIYGGNPDKYERLWQIFNSLKEKIVHPIHAAAAFLNPAYMCSELFKDRARIMEAMEFVVTHLVASEDKDAFLEEIIKYHKRSKEPNKFSDTANRMRTVCHPGDWWAYCVGREFPMLQKYAIRILSQPCSSSAYKQSLSAFETAHMKKLSRFTFKASTHYSWMNMILTTGFRAMNASGKPKDLTELIELKWRFPTDFLNEPEVPYLDPQPTHSSLIAGIHLPSQRCLQLQFVTRIPSLLVTGQEVKSEQGSPVHVILVDRITGNVVQDSALSMLNLTVSALEGDFDEESGNTWQREDFERNEITDVLLMTGNLQVTLKDGMGTLGAFCFNYSSDIAKSGKFKLGVKTLTDECGGICICEGISNAFIVKDGNDTRAPDATASQMHLSEDSQLKSIMDELTQLVPCPTDTNANSEMDLGRQFEFGPLWSPLGCKHKQKHNIKSGQGAMRWPKLKAIKVSPWATLRRAVKEKRAQKMLRRARLQKRLEECNKGDQDCSQEDHRRLQVKEKLKEIPEKYVMSKPPCQVAIRPEECSKGKSGSALDEKDEESMLQEPPWEGQGQLKLTSYDNSTVGGSVKFPEPSTSEVSQPLILFPSLLACKDTELLEDEAAKPLVSEECPSTVASFSCAGDSIPRKQDRSRWRHLFTLFPSSLSGDDTDLGEDKAGEFLKHTARQSTSPTKDNELVGMSNLSIGTSNYYSNTTGFSTTSSNAQFLKAVAAGNAEPDGRILTPKLKNVTFSELKSATSKPSTSEVSQPLTLFPSLLACKDTELLEDEEAAKPLELEECPLTVASFSCAGDSTPRKQDSFRWRHLFTLGPSSLSGDDTDLGEDKAGEFLKHTARQSTSPTKDNELVGMSNLSIGTSNYYSNTTGFSTTSSNARFLEAVAAGDAEPDGRILIPNLKLLTFSELESATGNFRQKVLHGEGGFGSVYKGQFNEKTLALSRRDSGIPVAVKKLNPESIEGFNEWQAEMKFVGRRLHPNIVRLLGYCWKDKECFLVSEYMQKGSLDNHLFRSNPSIQPLSWEKRLKIAIGAARGLAFLHGSEKQVIYRDFKSSNIFLDSDYNAKIADFGLARLGPSGGESHVTTRVMGTDGYMAPEYLATGHLSVKSDVYGFGVVLLELLTGRRALDIMQPSGQHLVEWARSFLNQRKKLKIIVDPWIEGQYSFKAALQMAELTQKSLAKDPGDRPSMKEVVKALEQTEAMIEMPDELKVRSALHP